MIEAAIAALAVAGLVVLVRVVLDGQAAAQRSTLEAVEKLTTAHTAQVAELVDAIKNPAGSAVLEQLAGAGDASLADIDKDFQETSESVVEWDPELVVVPGLDD